MQIIDIANKIQEKIILIETIQKSIKERGEANAIAQSNYDKAIAIAILRLRNLQKGEVLKLDDECIQTPVQATVLDKIARGLCWQEKLEKDTAEQSYKSCISNLNAVMAILNAYQSIFRHLDKA